MSRGTGFDLETVDCTVSIPSGQHCKTRPSKQVSTAFVQKKVQHPIATWQPLHEMLWQKTQGFDRAKGRIRPQEKMVFAMYQRKLRMQNTDDARAATQIFGETETNQKIDGESGAHRNVHERNQGTLLLYSRIWKWGVTTALLSIFFLDRHNQHVQLSFSIHSSSSTSIFSRSQTRTAIKKPIRSESCRLPAARKKIAGSAWYRFVRIALRGGIKVFRDGSTAECGRWTKIPLVNKENGKQGIPEILGQRNFSDVESMFVEIDYSCLQVSQKVVDHKTRQNDHGSVVCHTSRRHRRNWFCANVVFCDHSSSNSQEISWYKTILCKTERSMILI